MSEKSESDRNSREDRGDSPEETVDGPSGLERLADFTRRIVRVPKLEVEDEERNENGDADA